MKKNNIITIWGGLLIIIGLMILLGNLGIFHSVGRILWVLILGGIGFPFLLIYISDRYQWWSLIPGCTLIGVALSLFFRGAFSAFIITGSISLAFFFIYLTERQNWWALIPAWVMSSISLIIFIGRIGLEWLIAPFVMFSIAIPFLLVYLIDRKQWWALIPGGIMTGIGILALLGSLFTTKTLVPVVLILVGIWLIYRSFRPKQVARAADTSFFEKSDQSKAYNQPDKLR